ncbi:MAG: RluA family pseudouridine synthase [Clostridia bacterium]|nr:RluA family pseudouridine synthase [Clostridia bacterium]
MAMHLTVTEDFAGERIDSFIAMQTELSRSAAQKLIESGDITLCGAPVSKKYAVKAGDEISVDLPEVKECEIEAENIPLDIIYEDGDIAVINKPSGMVVHPAPGNYSGTLVNALLYHMRDSLSGVGGVMRPGIVHRIDKDTSGLLVIAKNDFAHRSLSEQLEHHGVVREYHLLVKGGFKVDSGTIDLPIGRHPVDRKKMAVLTSPTAHAKEAVTHYEVMERFGDITYVRAHLETGRTHQIRVHFSHLGHPLIGDEVYCGSKIQFERLHKSLLDGQALHAKKLSFIHPRTSEKVELECPLPKNFEAMLKVLRKG